MANQQSAKHDERRNYYRVDDVIYLEYRSLTQEEQARISQGSKGQALPASIASEYFDQVAAINKQLVPLLSEIRKGAPALARLLEGMNKKIDLLAAQMLVEKSNEDNGDCTVEARIRVNLSAGGIAFNANRPFKDNEYIHLRIGTATEGAVIGTYGLVIRATQDERDKRRPHRLRVKFVLLDDADRRMLMRHILARQREEIRKQAR